MTQANTAIVLGVFDLFADGKAQEALDFYAEDVNLHAWGSVFGGTYTGREGLLRFAATVGSRLPVGSRFDVVNVLDAGASVVVEIQGRGTLPGGGEAQWRTVEIFDLRDGKIVQVRLYTDTETIASLARSHENR